MEILKYLVEQLDHSVGSIEKDASVTGVVAKAREGQPVATEDQDIEY